MANGTYTGSYGSSFYLQPGEPNVTFTSGVTISAATGIGIDGGSSAAYTIITAGTITAADGGIHLGDGGYIDNEAGGRIVGGIGIYFEGTGSIYNAGYIEGHDPNGAGISIASSGLVTNAGTIEASGNYAAGVAAGDDETIVNLAGGTIEGSGDNGKAVSGGTGDRLTNSGLIEETGGNTAVLMSGGSVTNQSGGTITGQTGISFNASESTVVNSGYIYGSGPAIIANPYLSVTNEDHGTVAGKYAIVMADGGAVDNEAGAEINGKLSGIGIGGAAGTVENAGTITVTGGTGISLKDGGSVLNSGSIDASGGVYVDDGGSVTNTSKGVIAGGESGVTVTGAGGSVYNAGYIDGAGANGVGVGLGSGVTLTNAGTIEGTGGNYAFGVDFGTASVIVNLSTGTILSTGSQFEALSGYSGTIVNSGLIEETGGGSAIRLGGGSVTNELGGTITGHSVIGFDDSSLAGSVINAGVIETTPGSYGAAIYLQNASYILNHKTGTISSFGKSSNAILGGKGISIANYGLIEDGAGNNAIGLADGSIINHSSGTIAGNTAISFSDTVISTVTNFGIIYGTYAGIRAVNAVSIINKTAGTIDGLYGIQLFGGGTVENAKGAVIDAYGRGINGATSISNAGTIEARLSYARAIDLSSGTLTNQATGTISASAANGIGVDSSVYLSLDNAGVILGGAVAIQLGGSGVVTNETGGVIEAAGSNGDGVASADDGTVTNDGTISASGYGARGIYLNTDGVVTNAADGTISANGTLGTAVDLATQGFGSLTNAGLIEATGSKGLGIVLGNAFVDNASGGVVSATSGIVFKAANFSVLDNYGTIDAGQNAVSWNGSGDITNFGLIEGATGIYVSGGTDLRITNDGTIAGTGDSVLFHSGGNEMIADKGADFTGLIQGGGVADGNALELNGGLGTLSGLGGTGTMTGDMTGTFTGFGGYSIQGGTWTLDGTNALGTASLELHGDRASIADLTLAADASLSTDGSMYLLYGDFLDQGTLSDTSTIRIADHSTLDLAQSVSGVAIQFAGPAAMVDLSQGGQYSEVSIESFNYAATLDLTGVVYQDGETARYHGDHLYVYSSAHTLLASMDFTEIHNGFGGLKAVTDDNGGTLIEAVICFMPGTRIATPDGEVAVERLAVGDLVTIRDGDPAPIRWIGRQTVSTKFGDPIRILPIRIEAGTLGENLPMRDLLCSPDHAILIDDVLVQAGALVNGTNIRRETDVPEVFTYYHIECDGHELILAEGVPAETFVDNIDRLAFDNWEEHLALYPNGKPVAELPYPRAKSLRQVPQTIRERIGRRDRAA